METRCRCVYLRRGANNPKHCQSLSFGDQEGDRVEARFHRKDPGWGG